MREKKLKIAAVLISVLLLSSCNENYIQEEFRHQKTDSSSSELIGKDDQGSQTQEAGSSGSQGEASGSEQGGSGPSSDHGNPSGGQIGDLSGGTVSGDPSGTQPGESTQDPGTTSPVSVEGTVDGKLHDNTPVQVDTPNTPEELDPAMGMASAEEPGSSDDGTGIPQPVTFSIEFAEAPDGYFSDALFIGDSRVDGLRRFSKLGAKAWFCASGLSVYNYDDKPLNINGYGSIMLEDMLKNEQFGKVYIGLGINELGYKLEPTVEQFRNLVLMVEETQPDAVIYLMGNLHVAAKRNNNDKLYNNANINKMNESIKSVADGKRVFYIDVNEVYDDADGSLNSEYTNDDTHLIGKYFYIWEQFLKSHAILKQEN